MLRALSSASVVLLLAGCAHAPMKQQPQVNRAMKSDKYAAPKKAAPVAMPVPNEVVKKRWFPKYKIKWVH